MSILGVFRDNESVRRALRAAEGAAGDTTVVGVQGAALLLFSLAFAEDMKGPLLSVFPDEDRMSLFAAEMGRLMDIGTVS